MGVFIGFMVLDYKLTYSWCLQFGYLLQGPGCRYYVVYSWSGLQVGKDGPQVIVGGVGINRPGHRGQQGTRIVKALVFSLPNGFEELRFGPIANAAFVGGKVGCIGNAPWSYKSSGRMIKEYPGLQFF